MKVRKQPPTDAELREAYVDCRSEHRIALQIDFPAQARLERIKAMALWRWIDQRKKKGYPEFRVDGPLKRPAKPHSTKG